MEHQIYSKSIEHMISPAAACENLDATCLGSQLKSIFLSFCKTPAIVYQAAFV